MSAGVDFTFRHSTISAKARTGIDAPPTMRSGMENLCNLDALTTSAFRFSARNVDDVDDPARPAHTRLLAEAILIVDCRATRG
jgi:hypothetical protein